MLATALVVLCAIVFGPGLDGEYVWDDTWQVAENPTLTRGDGIVTILRTDSCDSAGHRGCVLYHPLAMSTLWLQARVTGLSIVAFRLGNLGIHLLCATLLVALLARLGTSRAVVTGAGLLFVFHPSVTEPVMWVVGRQDSLAALFSIGALLAWPDGNARHPRLRVGVAALLILLGLFCKETVVVVLGLLVVRIVLDRVAFRRALLWLVPPILAVVVVAGVRRLLAIPSTAGDLSIGFAAVVNYATIVWHYLAQLGSLANAPTFVTYRPLSPVAAGAVYLGLAVAIGLQVRALRRNRAFATTTLLGTAWFLLALAPHVVSLPTFAVFGNRYAYFPLLGLLIVTAAVAESLRARCRPLVRRLASAALVCVVVLACTRTSVEARAWRDDLTLYSHRLDPQDARALLPHAKALLRTRGCATALSEFGRVVQLAPELADGWHNLAGCFLNLGRYDWAVVAASRDVALAPDHAAAHYNLGAALAFSGRTEPGIVQVKEALRLEPGHARARELLRMLAERTPPPTGAVPPDGTGAP